MEIIKCELCHLDILTDLYDKVTAYLVSHVNYPKWEPGIYPGRESIERAIKQGIQYGCFMKNECETKAVGAFILNEDPQGDYNAGEWMTDAQEGEFLVIHTLASDPGLYRSGIGRIMIEYAIDEAKSLGKKAVRLDVVPDNIPARKIYEKMGFQYVGEKDLKRDIEEIPVFALYEYVI